MLLSLDLDFEAPVSRHSKPLKVTTKMFGLSWGKLGLQPGNMTSGRKLPEGVACARGGSEEAWCLVVGLFKAVGA